MSARNFIKENLFVIIGAALPVLLLVGALAATKLPGLWVEPPRHDFLFLDREGNYACFPARFQVRTGRLEITAHKSADHCTHYVNQYPRLYRYEARAETIRELPYDIPPAGETGAVAAAAGLRLDTARKSPDGYEVVEGPRYHHGDFFGFFGGYHYESGIALKKDGRTIEVPLDDGTWYGRGQFLGWVLE